MLALTQPKTLAQLQQAGLQPSFHFAAASLLSIVAVISGGLALQISLHSLMLICLIIAGAAAWLLYRGGFSPIREAMSAGLSRALGAIYIFILIGALIAAYAQSGTIATLIYYGLKTLSPGIFLPASLILCSLMSLATGTSWGTVGTAGVVLIGVGGAMGIPAPLVAGVVVSGAVFGDKMSPISDTTNLAAMSAGTSLFRHIKSMLYTTGPSYLLALSAYIYLGLDYAGQAMPASQIEALLSAIDRSFVVHGLCLLPLILLLILNLVGSAAEPAMLASAALAVLLAVTLQGREADLVLTALWSGDSFDTGLQTLDNLLHRGGILSMGWTLFLSIEALALGGILSEFGFLQALIGGLVRRIQKTGTLVAATIASCILGNMSMGEAYMSIILGGQLYQRSYDEKQIDRAVLSRSLEEGATLSTPLIPWTTAGAFFSTALGVPTLDYLPYSFLCLINPGIAVLFAYLGVALFRRPREVVLVLVK